MRSANLLPDVVLSDNSGAIFETLYANIPLAIYSEDINKNKLGNMDTTQYKLVKDGYIPYTKDVKKIKEILEEAVLSKYVEKQKELSSWLFYRPQDPIKDFADKIEKFLKDEIDVNYKNIHDVLIKDYEDKKKEIINLQQLIELGNNSKNELANEIENITTEKDKIISDIKDEHNLQIQELEEKINQRQLQERKLREVLREKQKELQELSETNKLNEDENEKLKEEINKKDIIIGYYQNGKLYKICKRIYELYYKIRRKK